MTEENKTTEEELETPEAPQPEAIDWKDKYIRTLAEMENMRKRMQKERQDLSRFGIENAISEFLPVIDNFESALRFAQNAGAEVKNWAIGFEMIASQFKEVLLNNGILPFDSEGHAFDADLHEAVEAVESEEHPEGTILQEFTKGYKSSIRTVRPARVKVAKKTKKTNVSAPLVAEETLTETEGK